MSHAWEEGKARAGEEVSLCTVHAHEGKESVHESWTRGTERGGEGATSGTQRCMRRVHAREKRRSLGVVRAEVREARMQRKMRVVTPAWSRGLLSPRRLDARARATRGTWSGELRACT